MMPDYQNTEITPDLEQLERDKEYEETMAAINAARMGEVQEEESTTTPAPQVTQETTQETDEGPKDIYGNSWPPQMDDHEQSRQAAEDIVTGVVDTTLGTASMLEKAVLHGQPGLITKAHEGFQDLFPGQSALKKFSGLVIPMLWGSGVAQSAVKGSAWVSQLPRWKQVATTVAAEVGVEAAVLAGSSSSTDDNMIKMFNDTFGTNLIGATSDKYHPSVNYWLNVLEGATLTSFVGALEVWGALRGASLGVDSVSLKANTPEAAEELARNVDLDAGMNPYDSYNAKREAALDFEAEYRTANPGPNPVEDMRYTYDLSDVQKPVYNLDVDKPGAVIDNARRVYDPTVGPAINRAVLTNAETKAILQATPEEHSDILGEVAEQMFPNVDAILSDGTVITQRQIRAEVDNVTFAAFNTDPKEFAQEINEMKVALLGTQSFLNDQQFLVLGEAFKRTFDLALSPDKLRAGGVIAKGAADRVNTASIAASLVEDVSDTTPQLVNAFENLGLLSEQVSRHRFAKQFGLERIRLLKQVDSPEAAQEVSERLIQLNKEYTEGVAKAMDEGRQVVRELREIAETNPYLLEPFKKLFLEAGNDVTSLHGMQRWIGNKLGVLKKAIIDGEPEVPSLIVQGMRSAMYNSVLLGTSLPRSIAGNAILTAAKPISALVGSGRGALLMNGADAADFKRSIAVYSGVKENFYRGLDLMRKRWKHINENPLEAQKAGRADLKTAKSDELAVITDLVEAWRQEGKPFDGRIAAANTALLLGWYNDNKIIRSGINALHAVDGFFSAFQGTGVARARAYDEMFQYSKGAFDEEVFKNRSAELFDSYFDANGLPTDEAVKNATAEISLNQPNFLVNRLEQFLDAVPAAQPTFMFARTGTNAFEISWSFLPTSELGVGIGKARKLLRARTVPEKTTALAEHGLEYSETMWRAKKNEYIGRTMQGQALVMAASMWALEGNLYGPGPVDAGERKRMMKVMGGNYFNHIKNPITGQWHDYRGMEPFSMILGLVGSISYETTRLDQATSEDLYRKVAHAITMNVTNQTFFKQFEPFAALLGKDPTAWTRFAANTANMVLPLSGLRSIVNNTIAPQLKDVDRDFFSMLENRGFKALNTLENEIDIYTGKPINYANPLIAGINSILPFLKSNGGMEPWRQWLVTTGWDGGHTLRKNPDTGLDYDDHDRQWINNYIAKNLGLAGQIEALRLNPQINAELAEYKKQLDAGQFKQEEFPIQSTSAYKQLDLMHNRAYKLAHMAWLHKYQMNTPAADIKNQLQNQLLYGDIKGAAQTSKAYKEEKERVKDLIKMNK